MTAASEIVKVATGTTHRLPVPSDSIESRDILTSRPGTRNSASDRMRVLSSACLPCSHRLFYDVVTVVPKPRCLCLLYTLLSALGSSHGQQDWGHPALTRGIPLERVPRERKCHQLVFIDKCVR